MAATDSLGVVLLRTASCMFCGLQAGLLLAGPAVAVPALFTASPTLNPKARLHVWSRLQANTTLASRVVPLVVAALASCAILVHSAPSTQSTTYSTSWRWLARLPELVAGNRRTLFTIAASLLIALRPYSFGLLTPRVEALRAEERRLLLACRGRGRATSLSSLGRRGGHVWRGASPTREYGEWVQRREREAAEESDVEDNNGEGAPKPAPLDTDALILELTRLQYGTAVLAIASFMLTAVELVCA
ncbi:hypothetical protein JCM3770_002963 [Rhodotorula araucariae]